MIHIPSDTINILVWIGFVFGSLNIKILDSFAYLISFGLSLVILFGAEFGWIFIFCSPLTGDRSTNKMILWFYTQKEINDFVVVHGE